MRIEYFLPILILVLFTFGCVSSKNMTYNNTNSFNENHSFNGNHIINSPRILSIAGLDISPISNNSYDIQFVIMDENKRIVDIGNGTAKIIVKDDKGNILYDKEINITENNREGANYDIKISGVKKSPTTDILGKLILEIKTNNQIINSTSGINVPAMTSKELFDMYNTEYQESATYSNSFIEKEDVKIYVKKYGYITLPGFYGDSASTEKFFRVDVEIQNKWRDSDFEIQLTPKILYNGKQYDNVFYSGFPGECNPDIDIYHGYVKDCYILFGGMPDNVSDNFTFELGKEDSRYTDFNEVSYSIDIK